MKGQDVAFKDVIEPLESVSVSIIKTDKSNLSELGSADEVNSSTNPSSHLEMKLFKYAIVSQVHML